MCHDVNDTTNEVVINETNLINRRQFEQLNGQWSLVGRKCKACNSTFMFPKVTCPHCLADTEFETVPFSGKGEVFCYTVSAVMPSGFPAPGIIADVTLAEGPRLLTTLDVPDVKSPDINIGMSVQSVIKEVRKDNSGNPLYYCVFVPVKKNGGPG